jgi:outer membrane lipoprotein-sorting protein
MFAFLFLIAVCFPFYSSVHAMEPLKRKEEALDPQVVALVEKIDQANQKIETLCADFTQKKELSLLAEPMSLKGHFFLKKNVGLKFVFAAPDNLELYFTKNKIISISHNDQTCSYKKIPKKKSDLTQLLLSEKLDKLMEYFSLFMISPEQCSDPALLLIPRKRKMKKQFREIRLFFNSDYLVKKISVVEKDGDHYEVILKQIKINSPLKDDEFKPVVPEDYQTGNSLDPLLGSQIGL